MPDYYNKAKTAVRKYYPKYEEYFKEIFNSTDRLNKQLIDVINYNLDNGIKKSKDEIKTEKQIYTVILMTIEKINWKNALSNNKSIAENEEERENEESIATAITKYIKKWFEEKRDEAYKNLEKQKRITERIKDLLKKDILTREDTEELLDIIEELFKQIENTEYINDKSVKYVLNEYYRRSKDIWRQPNETWKKIIKWLKDHQE